MLMNKYFGMFVISTLLAGGCGDPGAVGPDQTDEVQQHGMGGSGGFIDPNGFTQYYTGTVINTGYGDPSQDIPIRGIHFVPGYIFGQHVYLPQWYVMDATNDNAAPIGSITYGGQTVSSLSSSAGWFYVVLSGQSTAIQAQAQMLALHVGAPFNGTIQITKSDDASGNSGMRYIANFAPDSGGSPNRMNPGHKDDVTANCVVYNHCSGPDNSYLVPIAGTKWDLYSGATTTDANAVTFASGIDSVGGCVGWGYEPWGTYRSCVGYPRTTCNSYSMAPVHQACARMKRADFCGDGRAFTIGDTNPIGISPWIQLWDNVGVHSMTPQTFSTMEAAWSPSGATCVNMNELRIKDHMRDPSGHLFDAATSCSSPLPSCVGGGTALYTGSARPCTGTDSSGNCIQN